LFPDAAQCLVDLDGARLGIVTNGPSREQRLKLERLGIAARFERVIVSAECGFAKPDPRIFLRACEAMYTDPSATFYVGDHPDIDARAAVAAGLRGIWLDRSGRSERMSPMTVVRSLSDLGGAVEAAYDAR
jgi:putative hydrolase of the HAD superfamily